MITFPATTETFIAHQEAETGRKLEVSEKDLAALVVGLVNGSYQEGIEGNEHTITLEEVKILYQEQGRGVDFNKAARIWEYICWLCDQAYQAGKEAAQHD